MKFAAALTVLALAAQCLASASARSDWYEVLVDYALEYAKQELMAEDPYTFPDAKGRRVKTRELDLTMDQTNTKISKASTFSAKSIGTDPTTLTTTVVLNVPELLQSFDFKINGTAFGRQISGTGSVSISMQGVDLSVVSVFETPDTSLQINELKLDLDLAKLEVNEQGLQISGMSEAEVQEFISEKLVEFVKDYKQIAELQIARTMQIYINSAIAGKTLAEVTAFVKSLIHQ